MRVDIRPMGPGDRETWARMRAALRPEEPAEVNAEDLDAMLAGNAIWGFVAETDDGAAVGFAEITIRPFANGCDSRPVPFLEGIWVEAALRRRGIGARLVRHVEEFVVARGFCEIGSDALIENHASHAAHRRWGFCETERVVHFRKLLPARN
jgi:aminoglycoside 6'-N-acetyltransferase I